MSYSFYVFESMEMLVVCCVFCVSMTFYIEVESDFHQVELECLYKLSGGKYATNINNTLRMD